MASPEQTTLSKDIQNSTDIEPESVSPTQKPSEPQDIPKPIEQEQAKASSHTALKLSTSPKEVIKFIRRHSTDLLLQRKNSNSLDEMIDGTNNGETIDEVHNSHAHPKKRESRSSSIKKHFKFNTDKFSIGDKSNTPCNRLSFNVGVSENKNSKFRPTMEDVHTYVANFAERLDWGYFAIFDGHAGKDSARWCGYHLHNLLYDNIAINDNVDLRVNLNKSFQEADEKIGKEITGSSGCTAAVAVLRWEEEIDDEDVTSASATSMASPATTATTTSISSTDDSNSNTVANGANNNINTTTTTTAPPTPGQTSAPSSTTTTTTTINNSSSETNNNSKSSPSQSKNKIDPKETPFDFIPTRKHKRMLYTANVGDSRLVLSRNGEAQRLSYDHKSSDKLEQQRVINSGGIMLKNRVNGVLAVTRSLGDSYMKSLVIGSPYTTSTELQEDDEFLIIACDGLWDVVSDQEAVELIKDVKDPKVASSLLCSLALEKSTTDNVTVMVVMFDTTVFDYKSC